MKLSVFFTLVVSCLFATTTSAITAKEVTQLRAKQKKSIITLKNSNYESLLNGPRDFNMVVLLTASSPSVGCVLCSKFDPDYSAVADSWVKQHPANDGLYFAKADFSDSSRKVFERFKLNSVPRLFLFTPTGEATPLDTGFVDLPFLEGDHSQHLTSYIQEHTGKQIHVVKPVRYDNLIFSLVVSALFFGGVYKFRTQVSTIVLSKQLWGFVIILSILMFISGYMFNQIRGTPYIGTHNNGMPEYFMQGQQNQFGIETNIMSTVYGVLAFLTVALVTLVPKIEHPKVNAIATFVMVFLLLLGYSLLFDIFAKKSHGYPFRLLRFFSF
ncbi:dolichyl-diphosphooligosaccharide--protein glycotransferase [Saccharomycopsis crataegensis]|uniref:Dolichyl-diphosphooligosaccharide--protein glycotransferase n=1 Tax=Saccharomycopsis crataegensis TaxID=43959 RepID=A0AAV5QFI3_9ASCO|nr:dolichyl-diphosphooligosaccharide--protein glycotransferase [Saccharomycopsis crataegensis]